MNNFSFIADKQAIIPELITSNLTFWKKGNVLFQSKNYLIKPKRVIKNWIEKRK
jgi:hypothetical protein